MTPGRTLHRLAALMCCAKTLERVVEPAIADLQKEYVGANSVVRRIWSLLSGYVAILQVIAICVGRVSDVTDKERHSLVALLTWSAAMVGVFIVLLMVPPVVSHPRWGWQLMTTLVPQALGLAIPFGIAFGVAFGFSGRRSMNLVKASLAGALAASAINFIVLAWGVPAGSDAFNKITIRELRAKGYEGSVGPQKGFSEMTLMELRRWIAHFSADGEPRIARRYEFAFHFRFAFAAATLALASVLLAAPVNHRGWRGVLAFGACFTYWMLMFAGDWGSRRGYLTPPVGAWLPNVALTAFAIVVAFSRSSSRRRGSMVPAQ